MVNNEHEFLTDVLKGHEDAVSLCINLGEVSQVWDDLIDGDQELSHERINAAFIAMLTHIPANPFYQTYFPTLRPLIEQAIIDWMTANRFESEGSVHERTLAFVLRDSLVSVVTMCARIIGGLGYAIEVAPAIRRYFHDEVLDTYQEGLS